MTTQRIIDDVIREFLVESHENLDRIDSDLLELEQGNGTPELLASVFRGIHTIKGTCGFLGLSHLETVAHRGENLLSLLRDGVLQPTPAITDALLKTVDAIREILATIEETGEEGTCDYTELLRTLEVLADPNAASEPEPAPEPAVEAAPEPVADTPAATEPPPAEAEAPPAPEPAPAPVAAVPAPAVAPAPAANTPPPAAATPKPAPRPAASAGSEAEGQARPSVSETTIRVDVGLLDRVMNLVGELVLARNRILQFAPHVEDNSFANASQRLNLLTTELQEGVMKTRMQPIGNVWNKLPRVVRDLCHSCGKDVDLELDGTETELDRTIIEAIKDPLTHAVRNALDHGIETPAVRTAAGKPPKGRLLLRAYHEGGQVNIEIIDDGAGVNTEKVKNRAIERGLVSAERASQLSDREIAHFIFNPGFSTAAAVTNVSGRGVGMDVVKTNVEKIGGSVDINSVQGSGTTLRIKIPLTLAIIPALIVTSQEERFAIPQVNLLELVRLEGEQAKAGIERLYGTTLYRLRGELLPLVFLDEALQLADAHGEELPEVLNIVVLQADDRQFGLVVDSISDTEEIVVKPLGKELKGLNAFAGATIMGDGQVALILDVIGLAGRASLLQGGKTQQLVDEANAAEGADRENQEALLLFATGDDTRMAMPLSMVARLEELDASTIESTGGQMVVQYRGEILPLIDLTEPSARNTDGTGPLNVIVYSVGDRSVGFIVQRIIDTVDETLSVRYPVRRRGTLGAAVIQGRVTDLLDVEGVLRDTDPYFFSTVEAA